MKNLWGILSWSWHHSSNHCISTTGFRMLTVLLIYQEKNKGLTARLLIQSSLPRLARVFPGLQNSRPSSACWPIIPVSSTYLGPECHPGSPDHKDLEHATLKTAFLLALATAAWVSEIHALDIFLLEKQNHVTVHLGLRWDFIVKNQIPGQPDKLFTILSLAFILNPKRQWRRLLMLNLLLPTRDLPPGFGNTPTLTEDTLHPVIQGM